jgi:hypothetical protein
VSGQLWQGVSVFLGVRTGRFDVRTYEAGSPIFLGVRTWRLGVRTSEAGILVFLGCPDIPLTCPDTARVKKLKRDFQLIFSAPFPLPRDFLPSLT